MSNIMGIGEIIAELRKDKGLTQGELGKRVGYSKSQISKIEAGRSSPAVDVLAKLAVELGVDLGYFLHDIVKPTDYQVAIVESFIEQIERITTANEYYIGKSSDVPNSKEFIFSLLASNENPLILQMDKNMLNFVKNIAEIVKSREKLTLIEYKDRIRKALRQLNQSKPNEEINSYCLASIQDIVCVIDKAVKKETNGIDGLRGEEKKLRTDVEELQAEVEELQTEVKRLQAIEGMLNEEGGGVDDFRRQIEGIKSILGYGSREIKLKRTKQDSQD